MATKADLIFLRGTIKKHDGVWKVELPVINCRAMGSSIMTCIKDVESFLKKGLQDENADVNMQVMDGGIIHVTTSNCEAFRDFITSMTT